MLVASFAGNYKPSESGIIHPATIIYPIILISSFIFFIYWVIIRSKIAIIQIIIIIAGYTNFHNNFQLSSLDVNSSIDDIKVLTYNVQGFWKKTKTEKVDTNNEVIDYLSGINADILCIQEYHSQSNLLYEPLKEIRDTLQMKSYYYESYYNPRYGNLTGLVIFSKYDAIDKVKLKIEGARSFGIYTDLLVDKDTIRVFNIHLASTKLSEGDLDFVSNPESKENTDIRTQSRSIYQKLLRAYELREKQIMYLIELIKSSPHKTIMMGDFNDTPSSWTYKQVAKHLTDSFVAKGNGFSATYAGPIPYLRIDYIFSDAGLKVIGYKREKIEYSDHYPLTAIISLN